MVWYVKRVNGVIVTVAQYFSPGIAEEGPLPDDDPEVAAFLNPPAPPYVLSLEALWGRMTDEEAEAFDGVIATSPVRLRRMFNVASSITEGTELFLFVLDKLTTLFGEPRALEIIVIDMNRPAGEETAVLE